MLQVKSHLECVEYVCILQGKITHCNVVEPSTSRSPGIECISSDAASDVHEPNEPVDVRDDIKRKFLVEMPQDFYDFWDFAKTVNSKAPSGQFCFIITRI